MANLLGFLDAAVGAGPEVAPASEPATSAPARDEHGRFASYAKASEAGAATSPTPVSETPETPSVVPPDGGPPPPPEGGGGQVPITTLLEEREARAAEKAARERLEQEIARMRAAQTPPPALTRDEQLEAALYNQNLRASRRFAEREHGKETIAQVHDWAAARCDQDPAFNAQMRNAEDPYEAALQAYQREQVLQTVKPTDLAAFKAWQASYAKASEAGAVTPTPAAAQPAAVPRSLATASGTGGAGAPHVPVGPGMAFANALGR